jgi:lipoprotein-releasing system ATP-binding protein
MLVAKGIEKSYGALKVLKGVDLTVERGQVVSIVGASGAGKSTLLHMLGTLDVPDQGTISIHDKDIFSQSARELAGFRNKHIGFVFQFHNLLPEFSALENVMIPGLLSGERESVVRERAAKLLEELGLKDRINHKPSELSGGEQQRVVIARSLVHTPKIIVADEPTGNLDSINTEEIITILKKINEFGTTVVLVTHNREVVNQLRRRVITLHDGKIISDEAEGKYVL